MDRYTPDPRVLVSWELFAAATALPAAGVSLALWLWERIPSVIASIFTVCWVITLAAVMLFYLPARRRRLYYSIDDTLLSAEDGVLFRSRHRMPLTAVRHVTLLQGPAERQFRTAFLWVAGAGGWILLEGLPLDEALAIRRRLLS
ncbi:MAG: PH domain-containing protein [Clostridia bacterium]|nr:PH domain-containing protein [Clostridia bacterium]